MAQRNIYKQFICFKNSYFNIESNDNWGEWKERRRQKFVSIAVLNYDTSYFTSIGCESSNEFHRRIPYKIIDLRKGINPQKLIMPNSQTAKDVLEQTDMTFQDVREKWYACLHQVQSVISQENERPKTDITRLCVCLTVENRSSWK